MTTLDHCSTVGLTHFKYFQTWEMVVLMVTSSMFTNLKQKFWKCEVITAIVGNQLKLCYTRSCVQFYSRNFGLHPKNIFCYPGQDMYYPVSKLQKQKMVNMNKGLSEFLRLNYDKEYTHRIEYWWHCAYFGFHINCFCFVKIKRKERL